MRHQGIGEQRRIIIGCDAHGIAEHRIAVAPMCEEAITATR